MKGVLWGVLSVLAALTGILTSLVVRRTTDAGVLRTTTRKIQADLWEFRLFFDEPRLVWRAQMNLAKDNLRLMAMLLPAALLLVLPTTWLILQLEVVCGLRPLHAGEAAVVTAQLTRAPDATDRLELRGRGKVEVETPPIRMTEDKQVSWRIRASGDGAGALDLAINGRVVRKRVAAGSSGLVLSPRRSRSLAGFLLHPEEPRLPEGQVAWVEVEYPKREDAFACLVWFVAVSAGTAAVFVYRPAWYH